MTLDRIRSDFLKNTRGILLWLCVLGLLLVVGCDNDPNEIIPPETSTWETIQTQILTPKCTQACHAAGTSVANQSGLVLTADVAYSQLVDVAPKNGAARTDGLLRVSTEGLGGLYKSYLWEKLDVRNQDHFYTDHPEYGSLMPLNEPLTNGELNMIRQWIIAKAPETGVVVDEDVLLDTSVFQYRPFAPLNPPAQGMQYHLEPFMVPEQYEREFLYYVPPSHTEDQYVTRMEIAMQRGSHHFIAYLFDDAIPPLLMPEARAFRDLRDTNGDPIFNNLLPMQYHVFFVGTQWPYMNYELPPGVGLRFPAGKGLDLNPHYINQTDVPIQGEVYLNLHTEPRENIQHVADVLNLSNFDINLPPKQVTTLQRSFFFNERRHIFQLFSHAHEHMVKFRVEIVGGARNGEEVYVSYDWEHPPILNLDPPLTLNAGEGLKLITTYDNWTDRTLRFGLLSTDEMMILFGLYYPD